MKKITTYLLEHTAARKIAVVCFWLLVWQLASEAIHNSIMLCGPLDALLALAKGLVTPSFWVALGTSFLGIALGFLVSFVLGIVLGVLAFRAPLVRMFAEPAIHMMKSVPVACFVVLFLVLVGSRFAAVACVIMVALPPLYMATIDGLNSQNKQLSDLFCVFGVTGARRALALFWPSILPSICTTSKSVVGMAWKSGVAAELIGIPLGTVGAAIYQTKITLATNELFAWTFALIVCSALCERAFLAVLDWSGGAAFRAALRLGRAKSGAQAGKGAGGTTDAKGEGARAHASATALAGVVQGAGEAHRAPTEQLPLVQCENAAVHFDNGTAPFAPLTFTISSGTKLLLSQESGYGKTTLLRLIAGLIQPSEGRVIRNGTGFITGTANAHASAGATGPSATAACFNASAATKATPCACMFQTPTLFENLTAIENIALLVPQCTNQEIRHTLQKVLPQECLDKPTSQLSGGQQRRVELCRALLSPFELVLLDEPFAGLDAQAANACVALIKELTANRAVLIATHQTAGLETAGFQNLAF